MGGTMTAEPLPGASTGRWPMPPQDGCTVDDFLSLPDLPPHTELVDGSPVFVGPQRNLHAPTPYLPEHGLRATVPEHYRVRRETVVVLTDRTAPEPDLCVLRAGAVRSRRQARFEAEDVVLAVEVVSPESEERDRDTKPHKYARAGIPHFWRVEMTGENDDPVVCVHELDTVTGSYGVTGIHHDRLRLTVPYDVDIDLAAIDHM
ncbi:Uma2 family endonuclease [Streptomyces sp. DH37]|uniref:Uma2 family endonuclease n=1 Tax=Streptomyces sp. DH37 TaxID=3040122 RepID=UPI00244326AA|nr:Uma2 family endonuclease [Streptomyces sp. DH37]MDG9705630.1 Uma2 family endonuclease [Streptomyces sp. DH37]